jgi:ABC-type sugar transport system substrate-binding protein
MKSSRKGAAVLVGTALLALTAACGSTTPSSGSTSSAATGGATSAATSAGSSSGGSGALPSVQFVNPLPNYPAWRVIGDCMKAEAQAKGVDFTESGPSGSALDATVMIQQIQQAIANKKGAIVTLPASDGFTPVLQQAQKAGIVTATMYGAGGAGSGADINVGVNWTDLGKLYVEAIAKRPGQQNVGLMAAADTGVGKEWMDGMKSAAAATDNVKIVAEVYTNDDAAKALPQANALLTSHPEINVIASHMGTVTPGVSSAIKSKGLTGKVVLVGNGHDNGGTEAINDGTAAYILLQGLCQEGKDALDGVLDAAAGHPTAQIPVKTVMADKSNLQQLLTEQWG